MINGMIFDIITIFPKIFDSYFSESIIKRAIQTKKIRIKIWNLRDFTKNKHKKLDDKPYGGGAGMVLQAEPIIRAISKIQIPNSKQIPKSKTHIILFSASGKQFNSKMAEQFAKKYNHIILIAGRYEGVDERIISVVRNLKLEIRNLSIGPYVLTGGEIAAMAVADAVARHIPGVLGKAESLEEKRYGVGVPVYTRPEILIWKKKNYAVPKVLLSGDHKAIENWRMKHRNA